MAYMTFNETPPLVTAMPAMRMIEDVPAIEAGFSALEWSVIALAEHDTAASLSQLSRTAIALHSIFAGAVNPGLADPRLESLRRIAAFTWHPCESTDCDEADAFVAAGFTLDHYNLLVDSITAARAQRNGKQPS